MTGCKTDDAREFSLRLCIANRYTKRELDRQIGSMLYERTMISHEKHKDLLAGNGGLAALRDSYVFEFLDLEEPYKEKDLRHQIVSHLKDFILELDMISLLLAKNTAFKLATRISSLICCSITVHCPALLQSN